MNIMYEQLIDQLEGQLTPKRFAHTLGVAKAAQSLAEIYNVSPSKAYLAGLLHDCGKELPLSHMQEIVKEAQVNVDLDMFNNGALLHGVVGAILSRNIYGVEDVNILDAIRYHTTGRIGMTVMDKIIFVADYIEETRNFPGVDKLRQIAFEDLDKAVLAGYDSTIGHLLDQGLSIYFKTILGRNDILRQIHKA
ncbi:MAG: bis(5'-nucleosyl)-tetraphosphatase (symmetrical) YqeK [Veillonella sp.]|nr:bis(5'-nucleosyl)-tetraphosphatase (symmetrical) YqeK [Veillonella sp.]